MNEFNYSCTTIDSSTSTGMAYNYPGTSYIYMLQYSRDDLYLELLRISGRGARAKRAERRGLRNRSLDFSARSRLERWQ